MRVLVVDDDLVARSVMSAMLADAGLEIRAVADGRSALDVLTSAWRPDVMVLDYVLPEIDGAEVLNVMRSIEGLQRIPVIIVTARLELIPEHIRKVRPVVTKSPGLPGLLEAIQDGSDVFFPAPLLHEMSPDGTGR